MKTRFKNLITSSFGIAILLIDLAHLIVSLFFKPEFIVDLKQVVIWGAIGVIGYIFLVAKDSLLEGIALGFFKAKVK